MYATALQISSMRANLKLATVSNSSSKKQQYRKQLEMGGGWLDPTHWCQIGENPEKS